MSPARRVQGAGVELAVFEDGDPAAPTVLLVHGYPDTHGMWDEVVERLRTRYHVVTYDLRGFGDSQEPRGGDGFLLERMVSDLVSVADATSPDRAVHLVGHDWGSIQCWDAVTTPRVAHRFASFTSMSGPCLDHVQPWIRRRLRTGSLGALAAQGVRSWYITAFRARPLWRSAWRGRLARRWPDILRLQNVEPRPGHPATTIGHDGALGIEFYRQNIDRKLLHPRPNPSTDVPVQVLVATRDPYVGPALAGDVARWAPRLWRRRIASGHWMPRTHPDVVVRAVTELVDHVEGAPESRGLRRARAGRRPFQDSIVVVTGAGSGIGRATAVEFATLGAEVVVCDINLEAATRTAELARLIGTGAHPFEVDVSDPEAMERFAKTVQHEIGVPDVVVNNAGIGLGGPFLATTVDDWRRVIDVNLWGVIHGSRLFAQQMVERGEGGHIVNVASGAAFLPSPTLPAYSTTKAAVLMLSESLRGELKAHGIGVTAICPGVINTPIVRSARFVGLSAAEEERRRKLALRAYSLRNYPPERVAKEIVRAVRNNVAVAPVTIEAKALHLLRRVSPAATRAFGRLELPG